MANTTKTHAFVLQKKPYRETSLWVSLFSETHGRVNAIATGAKRPKSKLFLEPFFPLMVEIDDRNDLKKLYESALAPTTEYCARPIQRPKLVGSAYYLNELVQKLVIDSAPVPELFAVFRHAQTMIKASMSLEKSEQAEQIELALRRFETHLLQMLGFLPDCTQAANGDIISAAGSYQFSPELGFTETLPSMKNTISGESIIWLQTVLSATDYLQIPPLSSESRQSLKRFCRAQIEIALDGRPLKSRAYFQ